MTGNSSASHPKANARRARVTYGPRKAIFSSVAGLSSTRAYLPLR